MGSNNLRHSDKLVPNRRDKKAVVPTFTGINVTTHMIRDEEALNTFELEILYMHGDADGNTLDKNNYPNTDEGRKKLVEHCTFLAKCVVAFPHGMGGDDGYWDIEGYEEFGEEYIPLDNEYCKGHATVISFGIVYVDEKGVEFIVNLE